ncbi:MAG: SET domain-containing protein [Ginsengibacter sp.]
MPFLEKHLFIKESTIPGAGKGLFTKVFIPKGTRIIEYKGRITNWKDVLNGKRFNAYVYYVNRNHVIDAMRRQKSLGRYANDAGGLTKINGVTNNTRYVVEDKRVFLEAKKDIPAGEEILVSYGREYWQVIEDNQKIEEASKVSEAVKQ